MGFISNFLPLVPSRALPPSNVAVGSAHTDTPRTHPNNERRVDPGIYGKLGNAKDIAFVDNRWSARYLNGSASTGISIATLTGPVSTQAHLWYGEGQRSRRAGMAGFEGTDRNSAYRPSRQLISAGGRLRAAASWAVAFAFNSSHRSTPGGSRRSLSFLTTA
jgi:hypothetical protein